MTHSRELFRPLAVSVITAFAIVGVAPVASSTPDVDDTIVASVDEEAPENAEEAPENVAVDAPDDGTPMNAVSFEDPPVNELCGDSNKHILLAPSTSWGFSHNTTWTGLTMSAVAQGSPNIINCFDGNSELTAVVSGGASWVIPAEAEAESNSSGRLKAGGDGAALNYLLANLELTGIPQGECADISVTLVRRSEVKKVNPEESKTSWSACQPSVALHDVGTLTHLVSSVSVQALATDHAGFSFRSLTSDVCSVDETAKTTVAGTTHHATVRVNPSFLGSEPCVIEAGSWTKVLDEDGQEGGVQVGPTATQSFRLRANSAPPPPVLEKVPTKPESQVQHTFENAIVEDKGPTSETTEDGVTKTMFSPQLQSSDGGVLEGVVMEVGAPLRPLTVLDEEGQEREIFALDLGSGDSLEMAGGGFLPDSSISVYMFSSPTLLGIVPVESDGSYKVMLDLPESLRESGSQHTLKMVGYAPSGSEWAITSPVWMDPVEVSPVDDGESSGTVKTPVTETENTNLPGALAQGDSATLPGLDTPVLDDRSVAPTAEDCSAMAGQYGFGLASASKASGDCPRPEAILSSAKPGETPAVSVTLWLFGVALLIGTIAAVILIGRRKSASDVA